MNQGSNSLDRSFGLFEGIGGHFAGEALQQYRERMAEINGESQQNFVQDVNNTEWNSLALEFNSLLADYKSVLSENESLESRMAGLYQCIKERDNEIAILKKKIMQSECREDNTQNDLREVSNELGMTLVENDKLKAEVSKKEKLYATEAEKVELLLEEKNMIGSKFVERLNAISGKTKFNEYVSRILLVRSQYLNNIVDKMISNGVLSKDALDQSYEQFVYDYDAKTINSSQSKLTIQQMMNWLSKDEKGVTWYNAVSDVIKNKEVNTGNKK